MLKSFRFGFGKRIFASYVLVLIMAMILCSVLVSGYVIGFVRERAVDYNARGMATVVYELDSLYQRIRQFSLSVYEWDVYRVANERGRAYSFESLKRQLEYEENIKNSLLINGLKNDVVGMLVYLDDEHYYYVGDGVLRPDVAFSQLPWYQSFASGGQGAVIGPLQEDYRPYIGAARDVILFVSRLNAPASVHTEEIPFVMMVVHTRSVAGYLDAFFGESGAFVTGLNGQTVFSANLDGREEPYLQAVAAQTAGESGVLVHQDSEVLITGIHAPKYGWTLYAVNSAKEIFGDINGLVAVIALIFIACSIFGVLIAWLTSRKVMVPIKTMNQMINRVEQSEDALVEVSGNDEVAQIGQRFNTMKRNLQELTARMYLLEIREKQAQLQALQAQINPHFLYNTLDNIYCIAQLKGADDIATLTGSLSAMMRYSIKADTMYTTLESELRHVRQYVAIINTRHDGAICLDEQVDISLYEIPTVKLLLQPLVENAWKHGISAGRAHGTIKLSAEVTEGRLLICVEDDGAGMDAAALAALRQSLKPLYGGAAGTPGGFGIGLKNVYDRIRLAYGDDCGLYIDSAPGRGSRLSIWLRADSALN